MGLALNSQAKTSGKNAYDSSTIRIFGGVNRAFMSGADLLSHSQRAYYVPSGGISYMYMTDEHYGFSVGLSYVVKGAKTISFQNPYPMPEGGTENKTFLQRFNYITVPVHGIYYNEANDDLSFRYKFGFYYGYLLESIDIVKNHALNYQSRETTTRYFKRSDYGLQGGIEVVYSLQENLVLSLQLLHSAGIRNIEDRGDYISPIRTNATHLTMGVVYDL